MTKWNEKWIVYYDCSISNFVFCKVVREIPDYGVVIHVADMPDVVFDENGKIIELHVRDTHICSVSSWQQKLNRIFRSDRFYKVRETYVY